MANLSYIPIDSVLYDLSLVVDEPHYNEYKFKEWVIQGFKKFGIHDLYQNKVCLLQVSDHKATIPADLKYIIQVAGKTVLSDSDTSDIQHALGIDSDSSGSQYIQDPNAFAQKFLSSNSVTGWRPLRKSSNTFINTIGLNNSIFEDGNIASSGSLADRYGSECCEHEYKVDHNKCLTTTMRNGYVWVSYLAHASDTEGRLLIPDNEDLKEALFHYAMYKYWLTKATIKEQGAAQEREWHLNRFAILKAKATGDLNMPDVDTMENLKNQQHNLMPRANRHSSFFSKLNQPQIITR
jgi:hypothetical protein